MRLRNRGSLSQTYRSHSVARVPGPDTGKFGGSGGVQYRCRLPHVARVEVAVDRRNMAGSWPMMAAAVVTSTPRCAISEAQVWRRV